MEAIATGSKIISGLAALFANVVSPGDPMLNELSAINRDWNSLSYVEDSQNYGVPEYWATPKETRQAGSGDDEDLALGKMFDLVGRGYPEQKMKIAGVRRPGDDRNHVVLLVDYKESTYVLDSSKKNIYALPSSDEMKLVYRLNRQTFLFDDVTKLREEPGGLGNFRKALARMKEDGSLKGNLFPSLSPVSAQSSAGKNAKEGKM